MMKYVYIAAGGAAGSIIRYWVSQAISIKYPTAFPAGIFFVNLAGALLIGFFFGLFTLNGHMDEKLRFLLFIGFLGGFTTFSSFALENMRLMQDGLIVTSLLYIFLTNVFGIALAFGGYWAGTKMK